jgi:hypothetical protein
MAPISSAGVVLSQRVRAQRFLRFHREEVAVEHCGGLLERFRKRLHRQLDRKATGLPDAPFDFFHALLEVRVARVHLAPRVQDRNHRLACILLTAVAHLRRARTVAERTQVIHAIPAVAAQFFRGLSLGHNILSSNISATKLVNQTR